MNQEDFGNTICALIEQKYARWQQLENRLERHILRNGWSYWLRGGAAYELYLVVAASNALQDYLEGSLEFWNER